MDNQQGKSLLNQAADLYEQDKYGEALPLLQTLWKENLSEPSRLRVSQYLAHSLYELKSWEDCHHIAGEQLESNPEDLYLQNLHGLTALRLGAFEKGERSLTRGIEVAQEPIPFLLANRGRCRAKLGNHEGAIEDFLEAIDHSDGEDPWPFRNLSKSYATVGDPNLAKKYRDIANKVESGARYFEDIQPVAPFGSSDRDEKLKEQLENEHAVSFISEIRSPGDWIVCDGAYLSTPRTKDFGKLGALSVPARPGRWLVIAKDSDEYDGSEAIVIEQRYLRWFDFFISNFTELGGVGVFSGTLALISRKQQGVQEEDFILDADSLDLIDDCGMLFGTGGDGLFNIRAAYTNRRLVCFAIDILL